MHPSWGGYGGGHQPPLHLGPRPHQFREAQPPAAAGGGLGGYGAPSNFSSLQEQHLQQMQQLQQLHLKQLQSVLHHPGNAASGSGPSNWQTGGVGHTAPPNSFQDPSALRGPAGPPQLQPPPPDGKPPAPEPSSSSSPAVKSPAPAPKVSDASALVADEKPDFSSMSLQPSGITDTGDPAEAARLQQLQAAAAHWQHVQHQRASIQYQALMQEHAQLQQVLQQYQQVIQQPAHLQTMPLEMQLQHYEMQQQRFAPLYQEWDRHFNLWLEQFQAYPHKDQLHDYEAQWRQWQEQMNSTSAHLQERVTTLRAMKHQYGTASSYGASPGLPSMPPPVNMDAMPGPSPQAPPPSGPVIPQGPSPVQRFPSSSSDSVSETGKTAGPPGPVVRPSRPPGPPEPHGRFDGPRFEGPRGPRFEQPPQQRFSAPPRFDTGQRFNRPPRGIPPRPGTPARPETPPRQNAPTRFERPPVPPQQPGYGGQSSPVPSVQTKQQSAKPDAPPVAPSQMGPEKNKNTHNQNNKKDGASTGPSLTDDDNTSDNTIADTAKQDKLKEDTTKPFLPTESPNTTNKNSQKLSSQPSKTNNVTNGPPQQAKPPPNYMFKPDTPKEAPRGPHVMNQTGPPQVTRGRGRGQGPLPLRGRGRARGRGHYGGQMVDPNCRREIVSEDPYDHQQPDSITHGEDQDSAWRDPSLEGPGEMEDQEAPHEMWHPEEELFPEEYYEDPRERRPPVSHREHLESTHPDEHWEEEPQEYWEEEDPYWTKRRPPMHARPPFPPGAPRRPPFHPRFMLHGPRRPPPTGPPHGPPHMGPRGVMGPRFRRGLGPWGPPPRHDMMERDMRQPPPPHEILAREPAGPLGYEEEMDREPGWTHPRGRGLRCPPLPAHEIEREIRRPPMRPTMARERWHGLPPHEEGNYEEEYPYGAEDDAYRRPTHEYHEDYEQDDEYYGSREEWGREQPDREYPPCRPPEHIREDHWLEGRERSFPYEDENRYREERRGPPYADDLPYQERDREPPYHSRSDWERIPPPPPPERAYSHTVGETEPHYEHSPEPLAGLPASQALDPPLERSSPSATKTVLALSQRQHEIILKAAQELKMIRELQENNQPLEAALSPSNQSTGFLHSSSAPAPTATFIAKTVDYGHGRDVGATVERISYGERIVLRPTPLPSERLYEKGHRDPYYDRRSDPYGGPRDYDRDWERDPYREKPPLDYERDRYERDRHRDREKDHPSRSSRDREVYNRPSYDRSSYERNLDYPDERPPPPTSLPPSAPVAPPRVEKKPETKNAEDILKSPGRMTRPDRIVVIMRGLPGSGKSHVAKLIRDKEVECGGAPPRVLGLDDYFMTEVEKVEKDPDTGKRVKNKVLEYEYEPEMEDTYRSSMLKTFKKTLDDGFFPFIILDAINHKVKYFDQFWSAAKTKGFEVYLAEITTDHQTCAKRNIHGRTLKDITKLASGWESAPPHMVRLDIRSLLQDAAIEDVEMEDFNPSEEEPKAEVKQEDDDETDLGYLPKSKWEMDTSEAKLDKLDGLAGGGKRKRETDVSGMEDFLQLPDDYASRMSEPGKKRVRWADLEEKKDADRKRAIGFVVGQTDWEKITDESGQLAQRALNRTKYF
uniref:YLP motif-containing protein 1 n=1 Tax=Sinocyclocheilus anshuiensis TaxID=1608454 RepID=A0A671MYK2_9TELE